MRLNFEQLLTKKFDEMGKDLGMLGAALRRLEVLEERILEKTNFQEFTKVVTVMANVSLKTSSHREDMEKLCLDTLHKTETKENLRSLQEILKQIHWLENQSLAYASRLPLSLGGGWKPGLEPFSTIRHFVNLPGYLMMAPFTKAGEVALSKSLSEIQKITDVYDTMIKEQGYDTNDTRKEIKKALKDFRVLIRTSRQFDRSFRRTRKRCLELAKKMGLPHTFDASDYDSSPKKIPF